MEWNRWPISCLDYTSYESLSQGVEEVEQLDMALALQDQCTLLESLKVIAMAPTAEGAPLVPARKESRATGSAFLRPAPEASSQSSSSCQPQALPPDSTQEKADSGINGLNQEHFSKLYEATAETARSLVAALQLVSSASSVDSRHTECEKRGAVRQKNESSSSEDQQKGLQDKTPESAGGLKKNEMEEQSVCSSCLNVTLKGTDLKISNKTKDSLLGPMENSLQIARSAVVHDDVNAGLSQETVTSPVVERVSQAVARGVDHVILEEGLVPSENHLSEHKNHTYQLFRDEGQCSKHNGGIGFAPESSIYRLQPKKEDKAVDTSDLEQDDSPMATAEMDLISAALLFCLEESRECKRISDTVYVNGYRVDFGTQTFTFPAAILVTNTRVGDMASASACDHAAPQFSYPSPFRTLRLGLVLEALEVEAVPHNRYLPANPRYQHMFPFVCGQSFRRDQVSSHFTNVHGDIHAGLNGWMEHRCPLAYYGCTFSQRRFYPSTQGAKVVHDRHLKSFGVQPCPNVKLPSDSQSDQFSGLPIEILWHIAGYLDSYSLCQLSLVSRTMREVCASLLQNRGIVDLQWERKQSPSAPGTVSWQIKNKVSRIPVLKSLESMFFSGI